MNDLISRQTAINVADYTDYPGLAIEVVKKATDEVVKGLKQLPPAQQWTPCSERLPENTDPVNITWTNRKPEPYYASIKDVPFTATGHYCNGRWWWYSASCQDYLDEYGESEVDKVSDGIEILAWQPLPKPYQDGEITATNTLEYYIKNVFPNLPFPKESEE